MIDLTQQQAKSYQKQFAVELVAMYRQIQEDMQKLIAQAEREQWTAEKLTKELESLV